MSNDIKLPPLPEADSSMTIIVAGCAAEIDTFRASTMDAYARAAIKAYQRQQWQPIETAPQDGRVVLGVHGRQRPFEMYRGPHGDWLDAKDRVRDPSHWMPLPPAPDLPTSTVDNPLENPMTDRRQPGAALVRNTTSED